MISLSNNKPFERIFAKLMYKGYSLGALFSDFLELSVASFTKNEEIFQRYKSKYREEEITLFSEALSDLIMIEEEKNQKGVVSDYLGDFYMDYISHGEQGQFFTPQHICDVMAEMVVGDKEYNVLDRRKVNDPACGSGRTCLAFAKTVGQRNCIAILQDLDRRCCLMALINCILSSVDCEVYQTNALTMETYDGWSFKLRGGQLPICKNIDISRLEEKKEIKGVGLFAF